MAKRQPSARKSAPSPTKAKQILRDGTVHGKPLTAKQQAFMGAVAGKGKPDK